MDSHSVHARLASKTVKVAGIEFDNIVYDSRGDVLYLHVGDPASAVDFDGTAEGDGTSYGPDGSLVGITILNARLRLEQDGEIVLTLPERTVRATDLGDALAAAYPAAHVASASGFTTSRRSATSGSPATLKIWLERIVFKRSPMTRSGVAWTYVAGVPTSWAVFSTSARGVASI